MNGGLVKVALGALLVALSLGTAGAAAAPGECVKLAAGRYGLPVELIQAILRVEGGRVGQALHNSNGTEDLGPMQINTVWLPRLRPYGVTRAQLLSDRCINILVGSWILAERLKAARKLQGTAQRRLWWAVGSYHSQTPRRNVAYARKVWRALRSETLADNQG